jgi:DNA-binding transcriptional MerR regulator
MGLRDVLSRMKLVEMEPPPGDAGDPAGIGSPAAAATGAPSGRPQPPSVEDILASIPKTPPRIDEKILASAPRSESGSESGTGSGGGASAGGIEVPDFETIYRSAGISDPTHGYSASKVQEILSSPEFAPLESRAKAAALSGFLKMNPTGPVPISDVIQDAVRRDQALDKFEEILRANLSRRAEQIESDNARLQAEIDELTRRNRELMEANRRTTEAEQEKLSLWLTRKRIEEHRLFEAIAPFVEENPISTDRGGNSTPPPAS